MALEKIELAIRIAEKAGTNIVLKPSEARLLFEQAARVDVLVAENILLKKAFEVIVDFAREILNSKEL